MTALPHKSIGVVVTHRESVANLEAFETADVGLAHLPGYSGEPTGKISEIGSCILQRLRSLANGFTGLFGDERRASAAGIEVIVEKMVKA
jgi:hypothetical protein